LSPVDAESKIRDPPEQLKWQLHDPVLCDRLCDPVAIDGEVRLETDVRGQGADEIQRQIRVEPVPEMKGEDEERLRLLHITEVLCPRSQLHEAVRHLGQVQARQVKRVNPESTIDVI
jgi:hypothetical protein